MPRYHYLRKGDVLYGTIDFYLSFFSDEKAACAAIAGLLKETQKWNVVGCEVVCCTGNKCNTQNPTLPYPGSGGV